MKKQFSEQHISITDIAESNNVSLSTVYRILRGNGKNNNPRHQRVAAMLINAGYMSGHAEIFSPLLLIVPSSQTTHSYALLNYLQNICKNSGIEPILSFINTYRQEIKRHPVAGIISMIELGKAPELPCVYLNIRDKEGKKPVVCINRFESSIAVFKYLQESGFRRIGYLSDHDYETQSIYLKQGFMPVSAMYEFCGLEYLPELVYREQGSSETHHAFCRRAARYFAGLAPTPDALVLCGDIYAHSFIREMREMGIHFPKDICIASVDDSAQWPLPPDEIEMMGNLSRTEIQSIERTPLIHTKTPLEDMAECAVNLVREYIISPQKKPKQIVFSADIKIPAVYSDKMNQS